MNISRISKILLYAVILFAVSTLVACNANEEPARELANMEYAVDSTVLYSSDNGYQDEMPAYGVGDELPSMPDNAEYEVDTEPPYYSISSLQDYMFMGGGEWFSLGGDALMEWYYAFGGGFYSIPGHIIDYAIGFEAFGAWTQEFAGVSINGWRDPRDAHMVTLIEDFNLSVEDYIAALETELELPMAKIDELVTWARSVYIPTASDTDALEASFWMHQRSRSDIEALFSNNVYKLWYAFPGEGVVQNGRAYTPEWILHNIESAISEEQIPLDDIVRILDIASLHYDLQEVTARAEAVFQSEMAAR